MSTICKTFSQREMGEGKSANTWVWGSLIVKWCPLFVRGGMTRAEKVVRSGSRTYSSRTYVLLIAYYYLFIDLLSSAFTY